MEYKNVHAKYISIGKNSFIEPTAVIKGFNGDAQRIVIGDNCYIGKNVQILCDEFSLGDYSKIHNHTTVHGYLPCAIGHNAWIGQFTIIDSIGGVTIGNNCGIGAQSQLWSHIKYGDRLEGCNYLGQDTLKIGNDVWFVGHCIISPITAADKSMALAGSVVTKNMEFNTIYAGTPAKSISDKVGFQFNEVAIDVKLQKMQEYVELFEPGCKTLKIVKHWNGTEVSDDKVTYFNVTDRTYTKRQTTSEIAFMNYLLPEKGKFVPVNLIHDTF